MVVSHGIRRYGHATNGTHAVSDSDVFAPAVNTTSPIDSRSHPRHAGTHAPTNTHPRLLPDRAAQHRRSTLQSLAARLRDRDRTLAHRSTNASQARRTRFTRRVQEGRRPVQKHVCPVAVIARMEIEETIVQGEIE